MALVAQTGGTSDICADEIALHQIAGGLWALNRHAGPTVCRNKVARAVRCSTDHVVRRLEYPYAIAAVTEVQSARHVGANEVALNNISCC